MNNAFFAEHADGVVDFTNRFSRKHHQPDTHFCTIVRAEVEELIADIRQFIVHARNDGDAFEYFRLCEELKLAEAAHADSVQVFGAN